MELAEDESVLLCRAAGTFWSAYLLAPRVRYGFVPRTIPVLSLGGKRNFPFVHPGGTGMGKQEQGMQRILLFTLELKRCRAFVWKPGNVGSGWRV